MVQAGEMPVPFPGSWCRLSGKGSLKQGRLLGSPQPACVSSFFLVDSSNIHCSRARQTGTYHPAEEGGGNRGGPGGCRGGLCGFASPARGGGGAPPPPPALSCLVPCLPRDQGAQAAEQYKWMGPRGREEVWGLRDTRPADAACSELELGVRASFLHHLCC